MKAQLPEFTLRRVLISMLLLLVLLWEPSFQRVAADPLGTQLWYANFASGSNDPYFNPPQDALPSYDTCGGTISVVSNSHGRKNVGYYTAPVAASGTDSCREYPKKSFHPYLQLTDFYVQLWVFVPKTVIKDWISFITISFPNDGVITVNMWVPTDWRAGQSLYIYSANLFTKGGVNQPNKNHAVLVPFDTWVKIGLEVHLRPSSEKSELVLYQNGQPIITWQPTATSSTVPQLAALHFGLYVGAQQTPFSIYNSDIALYSLKH